MISIRALSGRKDKGENKSKERERERERRRMRKEEHAAKSEGNVQGLVE
jgi:hypothetical protein